MLKLSYADKIDIQYEWKSSSKSYFPIIHISNINSIIILQQSLIKRFISMHIHQFANCLESKGHQYNTRDHTTEGTQNSEAQTNRQTAHCVAQSTPRCAGLAQGLAHYQVSGELTLRFSRISSMYSSWTFSSRTIFPSSCPSSSHLQINRVTLRKAGEFSPIHLPVFGFNNFFFSPA